MAIGTTRASLSPQSTSGHLVAISAKRYGKFEDDNRVTREALFEQLTNPLLSCIVEHRGKFIASA